MMAGASNPYPQSRAEHARPTLVSMRGVNVCTGGLAAQNFVLSFCARLAPVYQRVFDTDPSQDRLLSSFSAKNPRLRRGFFALEQEVLQMSPVKKNDAEEERLAALEEIGIEEKALVYDEAGDKLLVSDDTAAIKDFYARAFQEWSLGNVEGTAEEIFEAVTFLIGDDRQSDFTAQIRQTKSGRGRSEP
jgi:hypothetical protein